MDKSDYEIEIAGNAKNEIEYLEFVNKLIQSIFNIEMKLCIRNSINTAYLTTRSKWIITFLGEIGYEKNKCLIKTPFWIWQEEQYVIRFIRGLFDTDGSIALKKNHGKHKFYPVITITLKDRVILDKIGDWLSKKTVPFYLGNESYFDKRTKKTYFKSKIQISGYKNVKSWINLIGSSNPKHLKKIWECGDLNSVTIPKKE